MGRHSLRESLWRRGWNDTKAIWTSWPFYILDAVVAVVIGGILGWYWGLAIVIFGMFCVWIGATARAPVKQRNEARELIEQQRKPSDSEVIDAIGLLEAETLVLKNNEGEESSYSFSQVFLALADQLSIGFSSIQFEDKIRKGLNINEKGSWYFPYANEGIPHVIGMLTQSNLVDRRSEEYQHMTRDYPQDITEFLTGGKNLFQSKPPQHLEKGTEVKYYLSPLGFRVIQKLRLQSVAHTEDSQIE